MFASKDLFLTRPSGYQISRSVRLRSSASAYFSRTPASASNRTTWTWSGWVKRGSLGSVQELFMAGAAGTDYTALFFNSTDTLCFHNVASSANAGRKFSSAVYRDPSAWYHIVAVWDTTNATAGNRMLLYVNGVQLTAFSPDENPSSSQVGQVNNNAIHTISKNSTAASQYVDGYMTEINFIDGQALTPSSFGETNSVTGVWQPAKYTGTYGTNGFYLNFSDNSGATATTIGKDYSGNGNNWTPNNISVTSGVTYDSMTDVPTLTSATAANYCVLNPLNLPKGGSMSNGNLLWTSPSAEGQAVGTMYVSSGKWYWEMVENASGGCAFGIAKDTTDINNINLTAGSYVYYTNGNKYNGGTGSSYGATFTNGDVIGVALDMDAGTLTFYKNNTSQGTAFTGLSGNFAPLIYDGTSASAPTFDANFGQRPFTYTPPSGYVALNTYNLPASTISNGATVMAATLYTGNGTSQSITNTVNGVSFQPDFVWAKNRTNAIGNALTDSVRGAGLQLVSNSTGAETNEGSFGISAFNSNGFNVGSNSSVNQSTASMVAWQWKAGGTSSSNTNGSITSTVSVGATQGFSVVTYTGTGANATVGHGLGVAPAMMICFYRGGAQNWAIYHKSLGPTQWLQFTTSAAITQSSIWNNTAPTSSVFSVGTASNTNNIGNQVAYCWTPIAGYSAFGSYTGNGSTDGPFVYCGFRPRWILLKETSAAGNNWFIFDTSRDTYNQMPDYLNPNASNAEAAFGSGGIDVTANGFKIRTTSTSINTSSATVIFAAFAENPFKNALAR